MLPLFNPPSAPSIVRTHNLTKLRAYDPNSGRWLSRDPIAERGGPNLYSYALNDPINRIDPKGDFSPAEIVIAGVVLTLIAVIIIVHGLKKAGEATGEAGDAKQKYMEDVLKNMNKPGSVPEEQLDKERRAMNETGKKAITELQGECAKNSLDSLVPAAPETEVTGPAQTLILDGIKDTTLEGGKSAAESNAKSNTESDKDSSSETH